MPSEPLKRPTLATLAGLWGQSIQAVSNDLAAMGKTLAKDGVEGCTKAKMQKLRDSTQRLQTSSNVDINDLKAREIETKIELNELQIAQISKTVVNINDLEPLLANLLVSMRTELLGLSGQIIETLELMYNITIDTDLIKNPIEATLEHIARYPTILYGDDSQTVEFDEAAAEDNDDGMESEVSGS